AVSVVAELRREGAGGTCRELLLASADLVFGTGLTERTRLSGLGRVRRILWPPAIRFQYGYVAVELEDGRSALVATNVHRPPCVVARTGDTVPGRPADRIQ